MKNHEEMSKPYIMTREVSDAICATICTKPPEQGGFLGSFDGIHIDRYYYDFSADATHTTYSPDTEAANAVFRRWTQEGVELIGNIHSHPSGYTSPSPGDIRYAQRIMDALDKETFLVIIAVCGHSSHDSNILYPYEIKRDGSYKLIMLEYDDEYVITYRGREYHLRQRLGKEKFKRIEDFYPMDRLKDKAVMVVGTGGAIPFIEDMARSGVGCFILIDPDRESASNIATSGFYITDIGKSKVEVAKERIFNINPDAGVITIQRALDDSFCDEELEDILGQNLFLKPKDLLICGCTDSFPAQARTANLAMKYGTCYLAAQLYAGGEAAEIYFSYPGVTNSSCPRCALSSRYEAYDSGYKNDVTTEAAPIFATDRLNALKGQIALMLLLYHEDDHCRFSNMLDQVADRNFVQINMSPTAAKNLHLGIFENDMDPELAYFDETVWIPQVPNNEENGYPACPLCGGTGDLLALIGNIPDSRRV